MVILSPCSLTKKPTSVEFNYRRIFIDSSSWLQNLINSEQHETNQESIKGYALKRGYRQYSKIKTRII